MTLGVYLIAGVMVGFEYVTQEESGDTNMAIVDLFIFRLIFSW